MIPKSGHRFSDKIMLRQKSMIPKSGRRFPRLREALVRPVILA
jgi:hypothetical protein